jgi:hypothetical protein
VPTSWNKGTIERLASSRPAYGAEEFIFCIEIDDSKRLKMAGLMAFREI